MLNKLKPFLNTIYAVIGLVLYNGIIQFAVYPYMEKVIGTDAFGNALAFMSIAFLASTSIGPGINYGRMVYKNSAETENGDYHSLIFMLSGIATILVCIGLYVSGLRNFMEYVLLILLMILTTYRYYVDVQYKQSANFYLIMIMYIIISVGYLVGMLIFKFSAIWELIFIVGEVLALIFVFFTGPVLRKNFKTSQYKFEVWKNCTFLVLGELMSCIALFADRIFLNILIDGTAVTLYYVASLVGKIVAMVVTPLNGVIIAYLSKFKGKISMKLRLIYIGATLLLGLCAFGGSLIVSPILIKILYPHLYEQVKPILIIAILGQVVYFCAAILNTFIVRYFKARTVFIIKILYIAIFLGSAIVGALINGLMGFSVGVFLGNLALMAIQAVLMLVNKINNPVKEEKAEAPVEETPVVEA